VKQQGGGGGGGGTQQRHQQQQQQQRWEEEGGEIEEEVQMGKRGEGVGMHADDGGGVEGSESEIEGDILQKQESEGELVEEEEDEESAVAEDEVEGEQSEGLLAASSDGVGDNGYEQYQQLQYNQEHPSFQVNGQGKLKQAKQREVEWSQSSAAQKTAGNCSTSSKEGTGSTLRRRQMCGGSSSRNRSCSPKHLATAGIDAVAVAQAFLSQLLQQQQQQRPATAPAVCGGSSSNKKAATAAAAAEEVQGKGSRGVAESVKDTMHGKAAAAAPSVAVGSHNTYHDDVDDKDNIDNGRVGGPLTSCPCKGCKTAAKAGREGAVSAAMKQGALPASPCTPCRHHRGSTELQNRGCSSCGCHSCRVGDNAAAANDSSTTSCYSCGHCNKPCYCCSAGLTSPHNPQQQQNISTQCRGCSRCSDHGQQISADYAIDGHRIGAGAGAGARSGVTHPEGFKQRPVTAPAATAGVYATTPAATVGAASSVRFEMPHGRAYVPDGATMAQSRDGPGRDVAPSDMNFKSHMRNMKWARASMAALYARPPVPQSPKPREGYSSGAVQVLPAGVRSSIALNSAGTSRGVTHSWETHSELHRQGVTGQYFIPSVVKLIVNSPEGKMLDELLSNHSGLTWHQKMLSQMLWVFEVYQQLPEESLQVRDPFIRKHRLDKPLSFPARICIHTCIEEDQVLCKYYGW
jgi:hypothetical protein